VEKSKNFKSSSSMILFGSKKLGCYLGGDSLRTFGSHTPLANLGDEVMGCQEGGKT